jgi:hypothetical protein
MIYTTDREEAGLTVRHYVVRRMSFEVSAAGRISECPSEGRKEEIFKASLGRLTAVIRFAR